MRDVATDQNGGQDSRPTRWMLLVLWVAVTAGRWWFASDRTVFHLYPDEPAQLAVGRNLAGRTTWSLYDHSTWQPGLGTLLAPVFIVTDDGEAVFRFALLLNAAIGGAGAVVLAIIVRRLAEPRQGVAVLLAGAVALMPASLSSSAHTWAEPLLTLAFLSTLLIALRFVAGPTIGGGAAVVVLAAFGYLTHGRLLPLLFVAVALVCSELGARRDWRGAAGLGAFGILCYGAVNAYTSAIVQMTWTDPDTTNTAAQTIRRISDPLAVLDALLGQTWYQLVATVGLVGVGGYAVVERLIAPHRRKWLPLGRSDATVILALTVPLVATSVIFISGRAEAHYLVYGRYNDAVLWPLIAVGAAWIGHGTVAARGTVLRVVAGVVVVLFSTTAGVWWLHQDVLSSDVGVRAMVSGLLPFIGDRSSVAVLAVGLIAGLLLVVLVAPTFARPGRIPLAACIVAPLLAAAGWVTHEGLVTELNFYSSEKDVQEIRALVPAGEVVGWHFVGADEPSWVLDVSQRRAYQLYQYYLPEYEIVPDAGLGDDVGPYIFAPREDPDLVAAGAAQLWESDTIGMVLWREPMSP